MLPGHEVFRLQFFSSAGRETHAKVWESLVPRAGHSHLFGAVLGGKFRNGVQVPGSKFCPEKVRCRISPARVLQPAFYPNFAYALFLPIGEQTDAVGALLDSVKVILYVTER